MGIYTEKPISPWMGVLILLIAFLAIHEPWLLGMRELFRQEGFYAVQAVELQPSSTLVTAHGVPIQDAFPLYPALSGLLMRGFGVPAEFALRTVSLLMLAATAVLTYFAAASERSCRAGLVAAGMYISTFLVLEKACDGDPATSNAFFLLAAHGEYINVISRNPKEDQKAFLKNSIDPEKTVMRLLMRVFSQENTDVWVEALQQSMEIVSVMKDIKSQMEIG